MACPARVHPLKKPEGHVPPVPRWQLKYNDDVGHVCTLYAGVQLLPKAEAEKASFREAVHLLSEAVANYAPSCSEAFELIDGNDVPGAHIKVWYWNDKATYEEAVRGLSLAKIHAKLPPGRDAIGLWIETFSAPIGRVETNYSGLDYLPGLARMPKTTTEPHTLTAYWGAARDRIPQSAYDLFEEPAAAAAPAGSEALQQQQQQATCIPTGIGKHLVGTNAENVVHIRSGQFWHNCDETERGAYEKKLEPTLEAGLRYLWDNPETGAMGLRYLRNRDDAAAASSAAADDDDDDGAESRKETCVTGFFSSLGRLEGWAKQHKSHLAIFNGAMRHAKTFGEARRFRTWHEVCVLKQGEAKFEYLNCDPSSGVVKYVPLREETSS